MSSVDVPIVVPDTAPAPKDYEIPAAQEIAPLAVRAFVDGTGAGGAFTPALQLISPGGQVMWTAATSDTVAAGASADVSWFPRVGGGAAAAAGIQFDVFNSGGWLDITTTSESGFHATGFRADSDKGYNFNSDHGGFTLDVNGVLQLVSATDVATFEGTEVDIVADNTTLRLQCTPGTVRSDADIVQLNPGTRIELNGPVFVFTLPTVLPGTPHQLWNDGGTVKVS